jgi:hypothetical protein
MTREAREMARAFGLPDGLSVEELATVLETTAAELRRGPETHEESLLNAMATSRERHADLTRLITGEREGADEA